MLNFDLFKNKARELLSPGFAQAQACDGAIAQLHCRILKWGLLACGCSCVMFHNSYLNLTQPHEIGTTGAQEGSNAALKLLSFKNSPKLVLGQPEQDEHWRTVWKKERSCFHPRSQWNRDSGLVVKLLHMPLSLFAPWGRHFVWRQRSSHCSWTVFGFRRGAGLALRASNHLLNSAGLFLSVHHLEVLPSRVLSNGAGTISLWCPLQTLPVSHLPFRISWPSCTCAAHSRFPFFTCRTCLRDGNWH